MGNKIPRITEKHFSKPKSLSRHTQSNLFGAKDEVPAVFSYTLSIDYENPVSGETLYGTLIEWLESIRCWTEENKYFIGHIKVIAENKDGFFLWLSTTGRQISCKGVNDWQSNHIESCSISVTAIIFGVRESDLKQYCLKNLELVKQK